ncbi:MAG TPA: hypothetical protein VKY74_16285 [Chloroflexia bacterium]|nr:hypothetical protein [Chloroflexia bacterium]
MLHKLMGSTNQVAWLLLGLSSALWLTVPLGPPVAGLAWNGPLLALSPLFWVGLALGAVAFFLGRGPQRAIAVGLLAWYLVATIAFIYPYAAMHDSVANTLLFPGAGGGEQAYSLSYGVLAGLVTWFEQAAGLDAWTIARFFPVGLTLVYLPALALIVITWRGRIFSSALAGSLFAFFFFAFGDAFNLRINSSPQTLGFLLFLIALGLLPLAERSVAVKLALLLTLAAMILAHPISPLLAAPGILAVAATGGLAGFVQLRQALWLVGSFLVGYVTWTMYRADWFLATAAKTVVDAFTSEKTVPLTTANPVSAIQDYILLNRIYLVVLLVVLVVGYFSIWRSRPGRMVTAWGIAFIPAFVVFLSYHDFFDRILLFLLVPAAVVFAEAGARLAQVGPRLRVPGAALAVALLILATSVRYFWIGAVDHITQDEVDAAQYLAAQHRPLLVYAGGFDLPVSGDLQFVVADRTNIKLASVLQADAVVISAQLDRATAIGGRSSLTVAQLVTFLQRDYQRVYTSGGSVVYMKRTLSLLGAPNGK